jgi:GNAT superfamily N-acetyltransferase
MAARVVRIAPRQLALVASATNTSNGGWPQRTEPDMDAPVRIRRLERADHAAWRQLWDGYNVFYRRVGPTALPETVTAATWERFFDAHEPVFALVAELDGELVGLVHYLFHRSTSRLRDVCYLQDLYTAEHRRGMGIARGLIAATYAAARSAGASRVYWQTQATNERARRLYDQVAGHQGFIVYVHEL